MHCNRKSLKCNYTYSTYYYIYYYICITRYYHSYYWDSLEKCLNSNLLNRAQYIPSQREDFHTKMINYFFTSSWSPRGRLLKIFIVFGLQCTERNHNWEGGGVYLYSRNWPTFEALSLLRETWNSFERTQRLAFQEFEEVFVAHSKVPGPFVVYYFCLSPNRRNRSRTNDKIITGYTVVSLSNFSTIVSCGRCENRAAFPRARRA